MKSILVIGMGRLGRHFATKMLALGNDVMIVDKDDSTIEQFSSIFTDSQIGDCRQEQECLSSAQRQQSPILKPVNMTDRECSFL